MSVGAVIEDICRSKGIKQIELGQMGCISPKTVSAIKTGRRQVAKDVLSRWAERLDHPRVYIEMVKESSGGVYGSTWLDGDNVDLHRTTVFLKAGEELREAVEALAVTERIVVNNPAMTSEEQRNEIKNALLQCLDARVAIDMLLAVKSESYGFSIRELFKEHQQKLESKGYLKKK